VGLTVSNTNRKVNWFLNNFIIILIIIILIFSDYRILKKKSSGYRLIPQKSPKGPYILQHFSVYPSKAEKAPDKIAGGPA
jgi:hypothetical protein